MWCRPCAVLEDDPQAGQLIAQTVGFGKVLRPARLVARLDQFFDKRFVEFQTVAAAMSPIPARFELHQSQDIRAVAFSCCAAV